MCSSSILALDIINLYTTLDAYFTQTLTTVVVIIIMIIDSCELTYNLQVDFIYNCVYMNISRL